MKKLSINNAVGEVLGHDITEVNRSARVKGVAFQRGHVIREKDLDALRRLGKNHIYVWEGSETEVHEDSAARSMAPKIAGENISFDDEPHEGKISFYAEVNGIFKVDHERLERINALAIPSLPTIHDNFPVVPGKQVAAFRIIPLSCSREIMTRMEKLLSEPLISVRPYRIRTAAVLVTGNEVHGGRVSDDFTPLLTNKLDRLGVAVTFAAILPDEKEQIRQAVIEATAASELVLVTGGTSVDPDDVTVSAMKDAGVGFHDQGNPIQPGNNLTIGWSGAVAVCAVPAAALMFERTALDIFLPRLLAGEKISRREIARSGHGGLCHFCPVCRYPVCPFGWGGSMNPAVASLPLPDAQAVLINAAQPVAAETIATVDALGRILAEDISAPRAFPDTPRSAVDGYAVAQPGLTRVPHCRNPGGRRNPATGTATRRSGRGHDRGHGSRRQQRRGAHRGYRGRGGKPEAHSPCRRAAEHEPDRRRNERRRDDSQSRDASLPGEPQCPGRHRNRRGQSLPVAPGRHPDYRKRAAAARDATSTGQQL